MLYTLVVKADEPNGEFEYTDCTYQWVLQYLNDFMAQDSLYNTAHSYSIVPQVV